MSHPSCLRILVSRGICVSSRSEALRFVSSLDTLLASATASTSRRRLDDSFIASEDCEAAPTRSTSTSVSGASMPRALRISTTLAPPAVVSRLITSALISAIVAALGGAWGSSRADTSTLSAGFTNRMKSAATAARFSKGQRSCALAFLASSSSPVTPRYTVCALARALTASRSRCPACKRSNVPPTASRAYSRYPSGLPASGRAITGGGTPPGVTTVCSGGRLATRRTSASSETARSVSGHASGASVRRSVLKSASEPRHEGLHPADGSSGTTSSCAPAGGRQSYAMESARILSLVSGAAAQPPQK
mmetsp:Transcript_5337/g.12316  ORF Transcript_5337/g.12316 Transcript_5337/m.12316 type:complete len:307 (-) Transcript_5337:190-1110(-)